MGSSGLAVTFVAQRIGCILGFLCGSLRAHTLGVQHCYLRVDLCLLGQLPGEKVLFACRGLLGAGQFGDRDLQFTRRTRPRIAGVCALYRSLGDRHLGDGHRLAGTTGQRGNQGGGQQAAYGKARSGVGQYGWY
jgi:hypothetical protein